MQLSKGQLNWDRLITVEIGNKKEEVFYRSAPCLGVKYCPEKECNHVVPIREKRVCPKHSSVLQKTYDCPVEFVYIHPKDTTDSRDGLEESFDLKRLQQKIFTITKFMVQTKLLNVSRRR